MMRVFGLLLLVVLSLVLVAWLVADVTARLPAAVSMGQRVMAKQIAAMTTCRIDGKAFSQRYFEDIPLMPLSLAIPARVTRQST